MSVFQADHSDLPLWAQVLLATRLVRRLAIISKHPAEALTLLDQLENATKAGTWTDSQHALIKAAAEALKDATLDQAIYFVSDSALAATDSLDFGAAESACSASAGKAIQIAASSKLWNPIQAHAYLAADLDLLKFACEENRIGRYDGLDEAVFGRLTPIGLQSMA